MELYEEILYKEIGRMVIKSIGQKPIDYHKIVESKSYSALQKVKMIIENDTIEDSECFDRIERIICALEKIGSDGKSRHDFG